MGFFKSVVNFAKDTVKASIALPVQATTAVGSAISGKSIDVNYDTKLGNLLGQGVTAVTAPVVDVNALKGKDEGKVLGVFPLKEPAKTTTTTTTSNTNSATAVPATEEEAQIIEAESKKKLIMIGVGALTLLIITGFILFFALRKR
jgi:hypothetical protein